MATNYRIPKLTDKEVVDSLRAVREEMLPYGEFKIVVHVPFGSAIDISKEEENPEIQLIQSLGSMVVNRLQLLSSTGHEACNVQRQTEEITDILTMSDKWPNHAMQTGQADFPQLHMKLVASVRKHLRTIDVEAALGGDDSSAWNRYRSAQTAVLNSLQQTGENVLLKTTELNVKLDKERSERFDKMESGLRDKLDEERKQLHVQYETRDNELAGREKQLADKEAGFETKEARYVARQKQSEQLQQIQGWLDGWSLTKGTSQKRWPIVAAYIIALLVLGWITIYATYHNYDLLKSADDIAKLVWWQWLAISAKSILPLAGFTSFMIYFIRWSSAWARQHAEEEFRNRTRLVDIGRSSWLLEAVRDAQENDKEIPEELLRQLSQNLFSNSTSGETDIHPQAITDLLTQGLSSIRVKSPDGAEVEASRGKK